MEDKTFYGLVFIVGIIAGILFTLALSVFIGGIIPRNVPSALDVYRGKTTFEITYKDSIAIDSTVVFR